MQTNNHYYGCFAWVLVLLLSGTGHSWAQNRVLTLKEVLTLAETNYPLAKAKADYTKAAGYEVTSSRNAYLPALRLHEQIDYATTNALQGTYLTMGVVPSVSAPLLPDNSYNPVYGAVTLAGVEWDAYTFGKRSSKVDMAKAVYALAMADEQNGKLQYQAAAADAYLNTLVLNRFTKLQELNLRRTSQVFMVVRAAAVSGLRSGADSAFAGAEVSKAKLILNEAYRNEQTQRILLSQLIGIDSLNYVLDTTAVVSNPNINTPEVNAKPEEHPLAKYYKSRVLLADATARNTQRSYWPDLKLLGYGWGRGSGISPAGQRYGDFQEGTQLQRYNYLAAASLSFNILDYPRIRAAYHAEREKQNAATEEYNAGLAQVKGNNAIAEVQLNTALKQLQEAPVQLAAANAAFMQTQARYNSGLATLTELTQVMYNLNRAEADVVLARSGFWKALLYKATAAGEINYFIQNLK